MNDLTQILINTPKVGLYALVNETDKKVFVCGSKEVVSSYTRHIREIRNRTHPIRELITDKAKLSYIFLEECTDKVTMKIRGSFWIRYYTEQGYVSYSKKPIRSYVVETNYYLKSKVMVELVDGSERIVVGIFDNLAEAHNFRTIHYPSGLVDRLLVSDNNRTKSYFSKRNSKRATS